jgi:thioredoxin reductase (NADPH)
MTTTRSATRITDACIIGAGPAGIFAVFQLGLLDLKCHVVDTCDQPGGQCTALYPEKPIYDIPGWPVISGQELTGRLMLQISPFKARFHLGQMAIRLERRAACGELPAGGWRVATDAGEEIDCKVLVIAAGDGSLGASRPEIEGIGVLQTAHIALTARGNRIPVDTGNFQTAIPGIFAVGDIGTYPGKLKLILSGFHETALMAQEAFRICNPQKKLRFQYTTSSSDLQRKLGI